MLQAGGVAEFVNRFFERSLEEQVRIAAEIRAGLVPMPHDPSSLGVYTQLLLAQSAEAERIEQQLAKTMGADDANAFVYGGVGCWERVNQSVGPRPSAQR